MAKKSKKTVNPELIINTIGCETSADVYDKYIDAKVRAGRAITKDELEFTRDNSKSIFVDVYPVIECKCECKKLPWYKRFWNWITRK